MVSPPLSRARHREFAIKRLLGIVALAIPAVVGPAVAIPSIQTSGDAFASTETATAITTHSASGVSCTRTSKNTCIRAGEFCSHTATRGRNAAGRALVCTKGHWHYATGAGAAPAAA